MAVGKTGWFADGTRLKSSGRDTLVLGVTFAAIALFIHLAAIVLPASFAAANGNGDAPTLALSNALILTVAVIMIGWRCYRDLARELEAQRKGHAEALGLADLDHLTQCLNRRSVGPHCLALAEIVTKRDQVLAFVMFDLDRFKHVNDTNGHAAGDALLQAAAQRIKAILPPDGLLARLGGDEFAIVVPTGKAQRAPIEDLVERVIKEVARPVHVDGTDLETSISAGIVLSEADTPLAVQTMFHRADMAMYHAKRTGRNMFAWFEPGMESEIKLRSAIETGIRRGIAAGEFIPHYEKQIDLETGEITGFEMLARWHSPALGTIAPDVFIPIAEEMGLISDLSESLIRQALHDAGQWNPRLSLSINISPVQLRDPWFSHRMLKMLVAANFPPARLEIEVTESCLHENIAQVRSLITGLKNQGVTVSLDDFGTGYSSLSQLRSLPFDRIKIDRSFVTNIATDPEDETIVRSIIALGKGLGLPVIAEGVENQEVLEKLRSYGNFRGQGYLYGQPLGARETAAELAQLDLLLEPPQGKVAQTEPYRRQA